MKILLEGTKFRFGTYQIQIELYRFNMFFSLTQLEIMKDLSNSPDFLEIIPIFGNYCNIYNPLGEGTIMNRMVIAIIIALIGLVLVGGCTTNSTTSIHPSNPPSIVVVSDGTPIPTIVQPSNPTTVVVVSDGTPIPTIVQPSNPTTVVVVSDGTPIPTIVQPSDPTTIIVLSDNTPVPSTIQPSNPASVVVLNDGTPVSPFNEDKRQG
jgi:hypothetical protein